MERRSVLTLLGVAAAAVVVGATPSVALTRAAPLGGPDTLPEVAPEGDLEAHPDQVRWYRRRFFFRRRFYVRRRFYFRRRFYRRRFFY